MAKDKYHQLVVEALQKDGWTITHDPYKIQLNDINYYEIDLGAERMIAAEKNNQKIAVEIKSFLRESVISDFHTAVGQFINYRVGLQEVEADRILFLALPLIAYKRIERLPLLLKTIEHSDIKLLIFDPNKIKIAKWQQ